MARMYDGINPPSIPTGIPDPDYVGAYGDGHWQTIAAMQARFPRAELVTITAVAGSSFSPSADVCDCETGDYTPVQAAAWARARIAGGVVPAIYCSLAAWPSVRAACWNAGVDPAAVDWWIAAYPGNGEALYPGSVAHQWIDHGTYDESIVADGWRPGRSIAPPTPPPNPPPTPGVDMPVSNVFTFNGVQCALQVSAGNLWFFWNIGTASKAGASVLAGAGVVLTLPDQTPQYSLSPSGALQVIVEDSNKAAWYFTQPPNVGGWNAQKVSS